MLRTFARRLAAAALTLVPAVLPSAVQAQKALVYCPVGIDAAGCDVVVAAISSDAARFPGGADAGYDGTQSSVDLATSDFAAYAVFVVPSLADGPDAQPYALLRNPTIAGRLQAAFVGRVAVWSGTPDVGSTNRSSKDALIRNLAGWASADPAGSHGPGVVALQDNSDDEAGRYGWLGSISTLSVRADTTFDVYSNVQVLTSTGQAILTSGGLQLGYTNIASFGLVAGPGGRNDATGDRTNRVVLVTAAGEAGDPGIATVSTDKDDYAPGDTVTVTGTGWEPGEPVSLLFHEDANPPIHPDKTLNTIADELGHIFNREYDIDSTDIGVRFTLTATGRTSGRTAQATFTDNKVLTVAFAGGGLGTVTGGDPTGITCPTDCTESVDNNATISLHATPAAGSTLGTWSVVGGATSVTCPTGNANCTFNMNNKAIDVTVSFNAPDLTLAKTHTGTFTVGTPTNYTISVKNSGSSPTSGLVTMTDVQPAGLSFTGASGTGWSCSGTTTIQCTRSDALAAGASYPNITLSVTPSAAGPVTNTASVAGGGESNTGNDSSSDPVTVLGAVDLTINKSHSGNFTLGTNGTYTVAVSNGGGSATTGTVTVTDVLPAGLGFVSGTGSGWTCGAAAGTVTCMRTSAINAGTGAPNISLTVSVAEAALPSVINTASVSGGGEPAANNGNNSDSDPTTVLAPDLTVTKSHTGNFTMGVNGVYTLAVSNAGGAPTAGTVTLADVLPAGLGFVSATGSNWTCGFATGTVTCTRTNVINAGNSAPAITLTVSVAAAAVPSVTNTASVSGGGEPAASSGNNSDSDPTTVAAGVDLTIDKSHTGNFTEGVNGTYTLTVSNTGGTATNATVTVTDALPAGLGFVSGTGTGWNNCTVSSGTVTCVRPAGNAIAAGSSAPAITLTVAVAAAAVPSVSNTASVAGGGEPAANNGNNSDSDPTTVIAANGPPVVDAGGPYTGNEGAGISLNTATATDPDAGDTPTYKWTYVANGTVDAGTTCSFSNDAIVQPSFTCTDDGAFTVTLTVNDGHGHIVSDNAGVSVANVKPVATAGGPYSGVEGAAIQLAGVGNDPGDNDDDPKLTYKWTVTTTGIDAGGTCSFDDDTEKNAKVTCTDDGAFKVKFVATDDDGGVSDESVADLTVANVDPVADAGGPYDGNEGQAVQLHGSVADAGSNDTHVWSWQYVAGPGVDAGATCAFDDPTATSPKITCTDDGQVKLTLTINDDNGGTGTDEATLTLANVPPVAHAGGPYGGDEGSAILLAGSATDAGTNDQLSYKWTADVSALSAGAACTFDDDTKPNARVTCTDDGTVHLTLRAMDDDGGADTDVATLTVANVPPVAHAGGPYTGNEGAAVQLHGAATDAGANDTHVWSWQYVAGAGVDAGATCSFDDPSATEPKITCTDDGAVKLTLKVTDDDGGVGTDETTLTLVNVDPVAHAGGPYTGDEGSPVQLNGSATDAGSNDTHTWSWQYVPGQNVDPGATCQFDDITSMNPKITCTDDGTVELTLTVKDDDGGTGTDEATLTLSNVAPTAIANGPYAGTEGSAMALNGSQTDPGANDTFTYLWAVNTSGIDAGGACTFDDATKKDAKLTCTDDGAFTLTLTVTDDDGGQDSKQAALTVQNANPVAVAGGPYAGAEGGAIQLSGSATDAGSNDPVTYLWTANTAGIDADGACTFDDATKKNARVTCTDDGSFTLTLTASDDDGGAGTSSATLTVQNANPVLAGLTKPDGTALPATIAVAGTLPFRVPFSDAGLNDTHTAQIDCGLGTYSAPAAVTPNFQTSCTFTTVGLKTISVKVTDDDGGSAVATQTITVKYVFDGFYAPVDRPNTMNVSKAGQAIPLKWRLTDANGAPITDLVAVTIRAKDQSCSLGSTTDQIEEYAAGESGLKNLGNGNYQFNWKTPSTYAGSCKSVELVFGAGALSYVDGPYALFTFKK